MTLQGDNTQSQFVCEKKWNSQRDLRNVFGKKRAILLHLVCRQCELNFSKFKALMAVKYETDSNFTLETQQLTALFLQILSGSFGFLHVCWWKC